MVSDIRYVTLQNFLMRGFTGVIRRNIDNSNVKYILVVLILVSVIFDQICKRSLMHALYITSVVMNSNFCFIGDCQTEQISIIGLFTNICQNEHLISGIQLKSADCKIDN